ncbi:MAG TPA: HNH endonuclease [Gemmatimonadales bacterium]|nr:HNH endonuclease [Gemmatimonadales bacterium]
MPMCIYCQRTDPACGFDTEHVIQQALGKFRNGLTLSDSEVCRDCNGYFGRNLDIGLGRDSYEALLRVEHGLKSPAELDEMFKRRVTVSLPADGTQWGRVILRLEQHPGGEDLPPVVQLVPQVGFQRNDGDGWDYFAEGDLRRETGIAARLMGTHTKRRVILFNSDEWRDRLMATIAEVGIPFKKEGEFSGFPPFERGEVTTLVEARFDDILARAVCKIAFNYMAKTQGAEFALRQEFDAARRYVRYAEGKDGGFLTFDRETRFRNSAGETRQHVAHLLTLEWNGEREELIGIVHLFGATQYAVRLCTRWDGIWRRIMSGHLFDLEDMEVTELHVTTIAPPWAGVPVTRRRRR